MDTFTFEKIDALWRALQHGQFLEIDRSDGSTLEVLVGAHTRPEDFDTELKVRPRYVDGVMRDSKRAPIYVPYSDIRRIGSNDRNYAPDPPPAPTPEAPPIGQYREEQRRSVPQAPDPRY